MYYVHMYVQVKDIGICYEVCYEDITIKLHNILLRMDTLFMSFLPATSRHPLSNSNG